MTLALNVMGQQTSSVTQITGLVRDSLTHDGIAYASISLMSTNEGTLANDRGGFSINSRANFSKLRVTAMGYKSKEVEIKKGQGSVVLIDLVATGVELDELVVHKGKEKYSKKNNPAVEMIKKLRARRDDNDPRRFPHYGYSQYERMMLGFGNLDDIISKPEEHWDSATWTTSSANPRSSHGSTSMPTHRCSPASASCPSPSKKPSPVTIMEKVDTSKSF